MARIQKDDSGGGGGGSGGSTAVDPETLYTKQNCIGMWGCLNARVFVFSMCLGVGLGMSKVDGLTMLF